MPVMRLNYVVKQTMDANLKTNMQPNVNWNQNTNMDPNVPPNVDNKNPPPVSLNVEEIL